MEAERYNARVLIHDQVFDKIQQLRYSKHFQALQNIKQSLPKSSSEYLSASPSDMSLKLNRYKHAQAHVHSILQPPNTEFINCQKHLEHIKNRVKLPKIETNKLPQNTLKRVYQKQRVDKENNILQNKISHLSLEKKKKHHQETKHIEEYEKNLKLSRRAKFIQNKLNFSPENINDHLPAID